MADRPADSSPPAEPLDLRAPANPAEEAALAAAGAALGRAGFDERAVCAFYGVPLVSDTHHAAPPTGRVRRGLGGLIALLVAGEEVGRGDVALLDEAALAALITAGLLSRSGDRLRAHASITPFLGALVAAGRLDDHGARTVRPPDLSAWNTAACLPPAGSPGAPLLDAGCGAGAIGLAAARRGREVIGYDVDERALDLARVSRALSGIPADRLRLVPGDVRSPPSTVAPAPGWCCAFNAPLVRAPLAGDAPLYLHAPGGDTLLFAFLDACRAALPGGEVICHTQLPAPLWEAASASAFPELIALEFARSPDGTPHALLSLRDPQPPRPRHRARYRTPLGPALPHLRRELLDRLHAAAALDEQDDAVVAAAPLRPAPWLSLARVEQHDGHAFRLREQRFGDAVLDDTERSILSRADGRPTAEIARDDTEWNALRALLRRGLLVP